MLVAMEDRNASIIPNIKRMYAQLWVLYVCMYLTPHFYLCLEESGRLPFVTKGPWWECRWWGILLAVIRGGAVAVVQVPWVGWGIESAAAKKGDDREDALRRPTLWWSSWLWSWWTSIIIVLVPVVWKAGMALAARVKGLR